MNRSVPGYLGAAMVFGAMLALVACGGTASQETDGQQSGKEPVPVGERSTVTLFFPGTGRTLISEEREIPSGDVEERVRAIVLALLAGPLTPEGRVALPDETTLNGVYFGASGVVYLDLHRPENGPLPPMGSLQETLMVYSFVNSVALNVQGVERVSLLWNGSQRSSLGGHLDNGNPLAPRPRLSR